MTLRRDFLAFTAGAVVARTILPLGARVNQPAQSAPVTPRAELERMAATDTTTARMLGWWDQADEHARERFLRMLHRVHAGLPMDQAAEMFRLEMTA